MCVLKNVSSIARGSPSVSAAGFRSVLARARSAPAAVFARPGPRRRIALAATGAIVVLALGLSLSLWQARQDLLRGMRELQAARSVLVSSRDLHDPAARAALRDHLVNARSAFSSARGFLRFSAPLLPHLGWLPLFGGKLAAAVPASDAAYYTSDAAVRLDAGLSPVLREIDRPSGRSAPGAARSAGLLERITPLLQRGHADFVAAHDDAIEASLALDRLPAGGDALVDHARAQLRRDLPGLGQGTRWLALAPSLLGAASPTTYLFAWEDPMELRATGGFIGASDFITVRNGSLSHQFAGRVPSGREINTIPTPLPEAAYTPETYWLFCDSNWSPDFPLTARLERWFYGEDTGHWVQGVIDFVDSGISDILRATGPIYLPAYHQWVDAGNVTALAQRYINGTYKGPTNAGAPDTIRKQFFRHIIVALQQRVETLPISRWPALGAALQRAVDHRTLLLYHRRPDIQTAIAGFGADGRMLSPSGDYLYVVDDNRSYNKINPYVHETVSHSVTAGSGPWLQETLTVSYHVDPSPRTIEGYGPGLGRTSFEPGHGPSLGPTGTKHDYEDFLRVYVPRGSTLESMTGADVWAPAPAYGRTQFAGDVLVREGESRTVTIRYRVPAAVLSADPGRYRLTIQHQPGSRIAALHLSVDGTANSSRALTMIAWPQQDVVSMAPLAAGIRSLGVPPGPAQQSDPYIPFASIADRRHPI